jgi:hypothetical protein
MLTPAPLSHHDNCSRDVRLERAVFPPLVQHALRTRYGNRDARHLFDGAFGLWIPCALPAEAVVYLGARCALREKTSSDPEHFLATDLLVQPRFRLER